jgi:hypothetical protein
MEQKEKWKKEKTETLRRNRGEEIFKEKDKKKKQERINK